VKKIHILCDHVNKEKLQMLHFKTKVQMANVLLWVKTDLKSLKKCLEWSHWPKWI